jgi:hypothetical protein
VISVATRSPTCPRDSYDILILRSKMCVCVRPYIHKSPMDHTWLTLCCTSKYLFRSLRVTTLLHVAARYTVGAHRPPHTSLEATTNERTICTLKSVRVHYHGIPWYVGTGDHSDTCNVMGRRQILVIQGSNPCGSVLFLSSHSHSIDHRTHEATQANRDDSQSTTLTLSVL